MPTQVKICGVTSPRDAEIALDLGATHLGLNFHPPSPRFLSVETARRIAATARGRATVVGVFVDLPQGEVVEIGERVGLDLYQFHGNESADEIGELASRAIKVFRLGEDWSPREAEQFSEVWGFLLEGRHQNLYGGTGESWGYERAASLETDKPVFIAGGIRPGNVKQALELSNATGVDVCSGVESRPGVKDAELLAELFGELAIAPSGKNR